MRKSSALSPPPRQDQHGLQRVTGVDGGVHGTMTTFEELTEAQLAEFRQCFEEFDIDNSGRYACSPVSHLRRPPGSSAHAVARGGTWRCRFLLRMGRGVRVLLPWRLGAGGSCDRCNRAHVGCPLRCALRHRASLHSISADELKQLMISFGHKCVAVAPCWMLPRAHIGCTGLA